MLLTIHLKYRIAYASMCTCTHIQSLHSRFSSTLMLFPPRAKDPLTKPQVPSLISPLLSWWLGLSNRLPKHIGFFYCPWLPLRMQGNFQLLKATHNLDPRLKGPCSETDPNVYSLRTSFHSNRRNCGKFLRKEAFIELPSYDPQKLSTYS